MKWKKALRKLYRLEKKNTFPLWRLEKWFNSVDNNNYICPCERAIFCVKNGEHRSGCYRCDRTILYSKICALKYNEKIKHKMKNRLLKMIQKLIRRAEREL